MTQYLVTTFKDSTGRAMRNDTILSHNIQRFNRTTT
ncbi:DUF1381 domain-containing protein [Staphylococcus aureus]|nr:DUF1381 domain-containing protein [Staphylococcus aureus]